MSIFRNDSVKKYKLILILFVINISIFAQYWEDPLFTAIEMNSLAEIKELIEQGEDVNKQDYSGCFPLEHAIWHHCDIEILQYLIDRGAYVNPQIDSANSELPLLKAVGISDASLETIKLLVKKGADVKATDHNGYTALMRATTYVENTSIVEYLIQVGEIYTQKKNTDEQHFILQQVNNTQIL